MLFNPRSSAGSTVGVHALLILSSLLLLSLPTADAAYTTYSNDTAADRSTPPTKSSLPTILIFCIVAAAVFFIVIGTILLYFYNRQRRERAKRDEHREKVWQFKDMQRSGMRPTLKSDAKSGAPIQISYPVLMSEATTSPRYPTKAFHW
ncbi:hypothetical protein BJV77DRAFT_1070625 [Russula vinacea]|nr:hypothetical protein BJV77DRAFT_1070625 [Russula vinacea]